MIIDDLARGEACKLSKEEESAALSLYEIMQEMIQEMRDCTETPDDEAIEGESITDMFKEWEDGPAIVFTLYIKWNRENTCRRSPSEFKDLDKAISYANEMMDAGDGSRIKAAHILDCDEEMAWQYGAKTEKYSNEDN